MLLGALALGGMLMLAWALWPYGKTTTSLVLNSALLAPDQPCLPDTLELTRPERVRLGETAAFAMTLTVQNCPDVSGSLHPLAEARLDLAGMNPLPSGDITAPLVSAGPVHFTWTGAASASGPAAGQVWLYFKPDLNDERLPLVAMDIEMEVLSLAGLGRTPAAGLGFVLLAGSAGAAFFIHLKSRFPAGRGK